MKRLIAFALVSSFSMCATLNNDPGQLEREDHDPSHESPAEDHGGF